jgi:hypothetical protein
MLRACSAALLILAVACGESTAPPPPPPPQYVVHVRGDSNACVVEVALVALSGFGLAATRLVVDLGGAAADTLQPGSAGEYWHETTVTIGPTQTIARDTAAVPGASTVTC